MRTERVTRKLLHSTRSWRAAACALGVTMAFPFLAQATSSQEPKEQARVPTSHANVQQTPGSGSALLVSYEALGTSSSPVQETGFATT